MFSPTLLSLLLLLPYHYYHLIIITVVVIIIGYITAIIIFTELLTLCDGCLGWGWVWRAELPAWLRVGQAFGVLLQPGFGVCSSSPQVPGHPTSMCNTIVKKKCGSLSYKYFKLKLRGFSRPYCCYGKLFCHEIDTNITTIDGPVLLTPR